jgi:hypothetical protein
MGSNGREMCPIWGRDLVGKPDGKRPLGRPGRKWEYNKK